MTTSVATREEDLKQLGELLGDHADELSETEAEAFDDMRASLLTEDGYHQLTDKQRAWLTVVRARVIPEYENLVNRGSSRAARRSQHRRYYKISLKPHRSEGATNGIAVTLEIAIAWTLFGRAAHA